MPDSPSAPPALLILPSPSAEAVPGAAALAGMARDARLVSDAVEAETALAEAPDLRLVLVCPRPGAWIAGLMAAGTAPAAAVAAWRAALQRPMTLLRTRRRRAALIFADSLAADPAACAAALGLPAGPDMADIPVAAADPLLDLIAQAALLADPAALSLAGELAATALAPEGDRPPADPAAAFAVWQQGMRQLEAARTAAAEAAAQCRAQEAETEHLREQIRLDRLVLDETREALAAETAALRTELETARGLLADRDRECDRLRGEIGRIHRSRSYRMAAPLRRIRPDPQVVRLRAVPGTAC
jgi:hypothetical protein